MDNGKIDVNAAGLAKRWARMKAEQERLVPLWRDISRYIAPQRGWFDGDSPHQAAKRGEKMLDTTPMRALSVLQSGMQGGLTSPSRAWFQLEVSEPELAAIPAVARWTDEVKDILLSVLSQSNLYNCLHGLYGELAAFGTGALILLEDDETIVRGKLMTAGEYYASFDARGTPDGFACEIQMTAGQMLKEFGEENISETARGQIRNGLPDEWRKVRLLIRPNEGKEGVSAHFPFVGTAWEEGATTALGASGYEEFPVMIPRWETVASDFYGYGPGLMTLAESKTLQELRKDYMVAQKMAIEPPLLASLTLHKARMNLAPGAVTYADATAPVQSLYQARPDIPGQIAAIADSRRIIQEGFYNDLFLLIAQAEKDMTATEVAVRQEEKLQMLGPVTERIEHELLNPLIGRTYMILQRRGKIPEPPEELRGQGVTIRYVSMLALAQKSSSMGGIRQMLELTGALAQMREDVLDKLDTDEVLDQFVKMSAIPAKLIRPDEDVYQMRQARAEEQAQAARMQEAAQMAAAAKDASGAANQAAAALGQGEGLNELIQEVTGSETV